MTRLLSVTLVIAVVTLTLTDAQGQVNHPSKTFWELPEQEKIINIAQYLAANDDITKKLIAVAGSLTWLEEGTNGNPLGDNLVPMVLDTLPKVFSSDAFKLAVSRVLYEISNVNLTEEAQQMIFNDTVEKTQPYNVSLFSAQFNKTLTQLTTAFMLGNANYPRAVINFLSYSSARQLLFEPDPNVTTVNHQCYRDTTDFLDSLVGTKIKDDMPNVDHPMWALKMFDSFGKVSGGLMKGSLYYPGSFDECYTVHAQIPANESLFLGGRPHDYVTEFDTRFCRATFNLPKSLTESFGVDTHGIELRLHWGMCMPASCHSDDVVAMFHMGMLAKYNLPVHSVYCTEDLEFEKDASAIVASVILALLVVTVLLCTLYETLLVFYNNNLAPTSSASAASSIEGDEQAVVHVAHVELVTKVYENPAYEHDSKEHGYEKIVSVKETYQDISSVSTLPEKASSSGDVLPVGYVHHKQGPPVFSDSLPAKASTSNGGRSDAKRSSPPPSYSKNDKNPYEKVAPQFVKAFSLLTNMPKVLSGQKSPSAIHCLHGIRFFSLCWVILGHTYNYGVISVTENPTTVNLLDADPIFKRFTFQGVMAGGFAVDTFFMLSGLLVTWLTLKVIGKKNSVGYWIMFYVHRFWRLTPLYMIVIMTFTCLHTYMGDGPLWPKNLDPATNCQRSWWTNLLYVNNLVRVDDQCLGWTWYLANDMQFYWISPLFLLTLFLIAPLGICLTVCLLGAGIASAFYVEYQNGGDIFSIKESPRYWDDLYVVPWCRVGAYAVGMILGYIIYKFKQRTLPMGLAAIGWVLTWAVGLLLCYINFTKRKEGGEPWPRWFEALYEAVGRPLWATCVGWVIFACHNNRGGFINSILSWEGFLPLSRLTYATYLVHPIVMMVHVYQKRALIYISDFDMAYLFMGHFVTSFLVAFIFSVCAEAPALALEKLLFRLH